MPSKTESLCSRMEIDGCFVVGFDFETGALGVAFGCFAVGSRLLAGTLRVFFFGWLLVFSRLLAGAARFPGMTWINQWQIDMLGPI